MIPYGRQSISDQDVEAVLEALRDDFLTQGSRVPAFEEAFAKHCGAKHAIACSNGTAALHVTMLAMGVTSGDRVVTSPITFLASANCAAYVGATPDFADIDPVSYCLSPESLEANWKDDTKAVIAVHYAGQPADMPRIAEIARERGAFVVEDACHGVGGSFSFEGAEYRIGGHPFADAATFSFHPVKSLTTGEGGMITTDDDELAEKCRELVCHGIVRDRNKFTHFDPADGTHLYEMQSLGFNYRLTDFQAALGLSQLSRIDQFVDRRLLIVSRYNEAFADLPHLTLPRVAPWLDVGSRISWHLYVVQFALKSCGATRSQIQQALRERGIGSQVHYIPVPQQPYYEPFEVSANLDVAYHFYEGCLSLPLYPSMSDTDVEEVIAQVTELVASFPHSDQAER